MKLGPETRGTVRVLALHRGLFAHYLKQDYARAASCLAKARRLRRPDTMLLNALGDSHLRLGEADKAKEAFEHSLELEPDQPAVEERLADLAGKPR